MRGAVTCYDIAVQICQKNHIIMPHILEIVRNDHDAGRCRADSACYDRIKVGGVDEGRLGAGGRQRWWRPRAGWHIGGRKEGKKEEEEGTAKRRKRAGSSVRQRGPFPLKAHKSKGTHSGIVKVTVSGDKGRRWGHRRAYENPATD